MVHDVQALDGHALQAPFAQRTDPRALRDAEPRAGADIERTERIACTIAPAEVRTCRAFSQRNLVSACHLSCGSWVTHIMRRLSPAAGLSAVLLSTTQFWRLWTVANFAAECIHRNGGMSADSSAGTLRRPGRARPSWRSRVSRAPTAVTATRAHRCCQPRCSWTTRRPRRRPPTRRHRRPPPPFRRRSPTKGRRCGASAAFCGACDLRQGAPGLHSVGVGCVSLLHCHWPVHDIPPMSRCTACTYSLLVRKNNGNHDLLELARSQAAQRRVSAERLALAQGAAALLLMS